MEAGYQSSPSVDFIRFHFIPGQRNLVKLLIYMVGFSEGFFDGNLAIYYLFKDDLQLSPVKLTLILSIPILPIFIRPGMGYLTDTVPIFGTRRKHYLILNSVVQSLSFFMLAIMPITLFFSAFSYLLLSLTFAFSLTIAEGLIAQTARTDNNTLSGYLGARAVSKLLCNFLSGWMSEKLPKQTIFYATAPFPLLITFYAYFMKEEPENIVYESHPLKKLAKFLREPVMLPVIIIISLMSALPGYDDVILYYAIDVLGFSPSFIGFLKFAIGLTMILVVVLYRIMLSRVSLSKMIIWTAVAFSIQSFTPLFVTTRMNIKFGIPDKFITLVLFCIIDGTYELNMLAFLSYSSKIAPKGLEASVLVCATTIKSGGVFIYKLTSSLVMYLFGLEAHKFDNLNIYIIFCSALFFTVIPPLFKIPTDEDIDLYLSNREPLLDRQEEGFSN